VSQDPGLPGVAALRIPRPEPAPGSLLLAGPMLTEPTFAGSVIALLEHDDDGSLGVILNRPSEVPVEDVLPGWEVAVTGRPVLFHGGPVGLDSALAVGLLPPQEPLSSTSPIAGSMRLVQSGWGLVDLDSDLDVVTAQIPALRIYAGYAGWSAGQLNAEVFEGAWFVIDCADPLSDLWTSEPDTLWSRLVARQDSEMRLLLHRPQDPADN
jgi:putative transcriptional regulator